MPVIEEEKVPLYNDDDDLPDEIDVFRAQYGIGEKFTCTMKRQENGKQAILRHYKNNVPQVEDIAKQFGPGRYILAFMYRGRGPDGGKLMPKAESFDIDIDETWRSEHLKWLRLESERAESERRDDLKKRKDEAAIRAVEEGRDPSSPRGNGLDDLRNAAATLKELGIQIGGGERKAIDWQAILSAAAIAAPIIKELFGLGGNKEDTLLKVMMHNSENQTKMFLGVLASQGGGGQMNMVKDALDTYKGIVMAGVATRDQLMKPEEKEGILSQVMGFVDRAGPSILELLSKTKQQRALDPMYNMAMNSPALKQVAADKDLQKRMIQKFDEEFGYQNSEDILAVLTDLGIVRPPELAGNKSKYPSEGFDTEGNPIGETKLPNPADAEVGAIP